VVAQQDRNRANALLLRQRYNRLSRLQRTPGAAQGAIRDDVDALLPAQVDDLGLRQRRVVLDLVDGGDDLSHGEQLLEVLLAVVADADGLDLAAVDECFHLLPCLAVVPAVDHITGSIRELREAVVVAYRICHNNQPDV
jgi:hypothetical protein